ncbi:unnamed protein product [Amoebophrya sp. A120]|nr:unnamed protein product [Amoebophrya sp. A120]|eukprot:GSA120T00023257001.1
MSLGSVSLSDDNQLKTTTTNMAVLAKNEEEQEWKPAYMRDDNYVSELDMRPVPSLRDTLTQIGAEFRDQLYNSNSTNRATAATRSSSWLFDSCVNIETATAGEGASSTSGGAGVINGREINNEQPFEPLFDSEQLFLGAFEFRRASFADLMLLVKMQWVEGRDPAFFGSAPASSSKITIRVQDRKLLHMQHNAIAATETLTFETVTRNFFGSENDLSTCSRVDNSRRNYAGVQEEHARRTGGSTTSASGSGSAAVDQVVLKNHPAATTEGTTEELTGAVVSSNRDVLLWEETWEVDWKGEKCRIVLENLNFLYAFRVRIELELLGRTTQSTMTQLRVNTVQYLITKDIGAQIFSKELLEEKLAEEAKNWAKFFHDQVEMKGKNSGGQHMMSSVGDSNKAKDPRGGGPGVVAANYGAGGSSSATGGKKKQQKIDTAMLMSMADDLG